MVCRLAADGPETIVPLAPEPAGLWSADIEGVTTGALYKFQLGGANPQQRNDPYARELTHSAGTSVVCSTGFDWGQDDYQTPSWDDLVIYELHVGTYNDTVGAHRGALPASRPSSII